MSNKAPIVRVQHELRDGFHIFTSVDVYGLYVASQKLEKAVAELQPALEEMLRLNYAINCTVEPHPTFGEFIAHYRGDQNAHVPVPGEALFAMQQAA